MAIQWLLYLNDYSKKLIWYNAYNDSSSIFNDSVVNTVSQYYYQWLFYSMAIFWSNYSAINYSSNHYMSMWRRGVAVRRDWLLAMCLYYCVMCLVVILNDNEANLNVNDYSMKSYWYNVVWPRPVINDSSNQYSLFYCMNFIVQSDTVSIQSLKLYYCIIIYCLVTVLLKYSIYCDYSHYSLISMTDDKYIQ